MISNVKTSSVSKSGTYGEEQLIRVSGCIISFADELKRSIRGAQLTASDRKHSTRRGGSAVLPCAFVRLAITAAGAPNREIGRFAMRTSIGLLCSLSVPLGCAPPITELGPDASRTGTNATVATDVSDSGIIVGTAFIEGDAQRWAVQVDDDNALIRLPPLPGYPHCEARAVASDGTIAGICSGADTGPSFAAVFWDPAHAIRRFLPLDYGIQPDMMDINNHGVILGQSYTSAMRPWTYDTRTERLLELSTPSEATDIRASAINDRGEVVGTLTVEDRTGGGRRSFPIQWSADGQTVFRLPLPPDCGGGASAINNLGVIVGTTGCWNGDKGPTIWSSRDALPQMLIVPPAYTPSLTWVTGVSDAGRVIGAGQHLGFGDTFVLFGLGWTEQRQPVVFANTVLEAINASGVTVGRRGSAAVTVDW
jgi:uncharacterized membrane protein